MHLLGETKEGDNCCREVYHLSLYINLFRREVRERKEDEIVKKESKRCREEVDAFYGLGFSIRWIEFYFF
jgi:hypothetical protein